MAERRGACERLPLPLLPLLIASCGEAEEARRGEEHGINCTHSPTTRDYYALNSVRKPPPEDVRSVRAAEDPCTGRGVEVAGPGLWRCPITRVGWQALPAGGRHVVRGRQAAGPQPGARAS